MKTSIYYKTISVSIFNCSSTPLSWVNWLVHVFKFDNYSQQFVNLQVLHNLSDVTMTENCVIVTSRKTNAHWLIFRTLINTGDVLDCNSWLGIKCSRLKINVNNFKSCEQNSGWSFSGCYNDTNLIHLLPSIMSLSFQLYIYHILMYNNIYFFTLGIKGMNFLFQR